MVNLVAARKPLLKVLMKMAGVKPYLVQIEPGTTMNIWVPKETIKKPKKGKQQKTQTTLEKPNKPVVVLIHGFAGDGMLTWMFQVGALTKKYSVYVPDLLFFGDSVTDNADRSPSFQAECLVKSLKKLGVDKCVLVGFCYGAMVSFRILEVYPDLVEAVVVSGWVFEMNDAINKKRLNKFGFGLLSDMLLPDSVKGTKAVLSVGAYRKLWLPNKIHKDYLKAMFIHRKEMAKLVDAIFISNNNGFQISTFYQRIHLLWGEEDQIFTIKSAQNMMMQLGKNASLESIKKAGHVAQLERPCVYNKCLKNFLKSLHQEGAKN